MTNKNIVRVLGTYLDPSDVVALEMCLERNETFRRVYTLYAHLKYGSKIRLDSSIDNDLYDIMDILARSLFSSPNVYFYLMNAIRDDEGNIKEFVISKDER